MIEGEGDNSSTVNSGTPAGQWLERLAEAERVDRFWHDKCDNIDKRYADLEMLASEVGDREYQIFWANVEVKKQAIYARPPVPVVSSRFNDRKPLARRTADILERALISDFDADDVHSTLIQCRDDLELNSRGVVWLGLKDRDGLQVPCAYHLDRKDYRHSPARKEQEIVWKGRRSWNTRAEVKARFGRIPETLTFQQQNIGGKYEGEQKAAIWECWDKPTKRVVWVSEGCPELLDERKPWYNLTGFFPCVAAYGTLKRSTLIPVPDFVYYSDQIAEINELTCRIAALADGLKVRGLYASGTPELADEMEKLLSQRGDDVLLIPVPSLGNLAIKDIIMFLPLAEISAAVQVCVELRRVIIDDVYQISGISDIMRGETDAQETLGAQQLKSQYGSARIKAKQVEMQRVARDITRMKGEMLAENVGIEDLLTMAQVDDLPTEQDLMAQIQPIVQQAEQQMMAIIDQGRMMQAQAQMGGMVPQGQDPMEGLRAQGMQIQQQAQAQIDQIKQTVTVEKVAQLLKDQKTRPFVLDIETDSTIEPDQQAEKQQRIEFAGAMGPLLQQGIEAMNVAGAQAGALGKFFAEGLRYMASGFRSDRRMDEAIDELAEALAQFQPAPQGEDPAIAQAEAQKAQADIEVAQLKLEAEKAKAQGVGMEAEKTAAETNKLQAEAEKIRSEIGVAAAKAQMDQQMAQEKHALEREGLVMERDNARKQFELDHTEAKAKHGLERQRLEHEARSAEMKFKESEAAAKPRVKRTRITRHDERGRPLEFESHEDNA